MKLSNNFLLNVFFCFISHVIFFSFLAVNPQLFLVFIVTFMVTLFYLFLSFFHPFFPCTVYFRSNIFLYLYFLLIFPFYILNKIKIARMRDLQIWQNYTILNPYPSFSIIFAFSTCFTYIFVFNRYIPLETLLLVIEMNRKIDKQKIRQTNKPTEIRQAEKLKKVLRITQKQ